MVLFLGAIGFILPGYLLYRFFVGSILWVCEPMIQHVEAKEARELKFMEKMEGVADELKKKGAGGIPAAACGEEEGRGRDEEPPDRWPRRFSEGDLN